MDFIKGYLIGSFEDLKKQAKWVLLALVAILALVGGYFAYKYYDERMQRRAHKSFIEALEYINVPVASSPEEKEKLTKEEKIFFSTEEEKWNKVAAVFKEAYENNKQSGLAGLFLAQESSAVLKIGKPEVARTLLEQAIPLIKENNVKSLYQIKLALLDLDSKDQGVVEKGAALLKSLASDSSTPANDLALYYLGNHYWNNQNFNEAKNYWNQLTHKYGADSPHPSPFALRAKDRLKLIS